MSFFVLGIDPGTRRVGYGLVEIQANQYRAVDYGFIQVNNRLEFPSRLKQIHEDTSSLLEKYQPDIMAVEEVYVSSNAKATLRLGHARGVIILAAVEKNIPVAEYAPREIKQAVLGNGNASKVQIQWMMSQILHLNQKTLSEDSADGLAVALCHGFRRRG